MLKWVNYRSKVIRTIQHLGFWALSFYISFRLFSYSKESAKTDLIYTALFHASLLFEVYGNTLLLFPRFLEKSKYGQYLLASIGWMLLGAALNFLTFAYLADWIFPGYYFISYYTLREILQFMLVYWSVSTLLKLSKSWFRMQEQKKQIQRLEKEKTTAELAALKAQIDPHFLFNNLNSLYSLALEHDDRTPDAILSLADNMRYVLYDSQSEKVPLEKEIQHLQNYLQLQQWRNEGQIDIEFIVNNNQEGQLIAPLLLLPLLENGFKHARRSRKGAFFIHAELTNNPEHLILRVSNSRNPASVEESTTKAGGVGLQNLRRRLDLLYPGKYELVMQEEADIFSVSLKLKWL